MFPLFFEHIFLLTEHAVLIIFSVDRYAKSIYIEKGCLVCHGAPAGELDPYGHPKEGYEIGDIRGAISVALPDN
ncbi:MAG: DUF3365 domain-containing protein [bacterium]|nr:DUF3365 domain-containing protein [bacterium]